jgi:putative membrane protein
MKTILKFILTALAVLVIAHFLKGVSVEDYTDALWVAFALGLLKVFVRPLLILFTLPVTVLTLGFFLLVINAIIILLADYFVSGFHVNGFWTAFLFSIILSITQSILFSFVKNEVKN